MQAEGRSRVEQRDVEFVNGALEEGVVSELLAKQGGGGQGAGAGTKCARVLPLCCRCALWADSAHRKCHGGHEAVRAVCVAWSRYVCGVSSAGIEAHAGGGLLRAEEGDTWGNGCGV